MTFATGGAFFHVNEPGGLCEGHREITGTAIYGIHRGQGHQFNVEMTSRLHKFRGDDAHGAVIGGKGFIQLGHDTANGGIFFHKIYKITRIGKIQGGLNPCNTSADNHYRSNLVSGHYVSSFSSPWSARSGPR